MSRSAANLRLISTPSPREAARAALANHRHAPATAPENPIVNIHASDAGRPVPRLEVDEILARSIPRGGQTQ